MTIYDNICRNNMTTDFTWEIIAQVKKRRGSGSYLQQKYVTNKKALTNK